MSWRCSNRQKADFSRGVHAFQRGEFKTALSGFKPLAEQGLAAAQYSLGGMYFEGKGVAQDYVYAYMWLNISSSSGEQDAAKHLGIIAEQMTSFQLKKAQDLARECVAKNYKLCI